MYRPSQFPFCESQDYLLHFAHLFFVFPTVLSIEYKSIVWIVNNVIELIGHLFPFLRNFLNFLQV